MPCYANNGHIYVLINSLHLVIDLFIQASKCKYSLGVYVWCYTSSVAQGDLFTGAMSLC